MNDCDICRRLSFTYKAKPVPAFAIAERPMKREIMKKVTGFLQGPI